MPYISRQARENIAPYLDPLLAMLTLFPADKDAINYIITRIVVQVYAKGSYEQRSQGAAVLQDAHDEYYRRIMAPYEDKKCQEDGDVY